MVKPDRRIVLTVTLLSIIATAFLIVSLVSEEWVTAHGKFIDDNIINQDENTLSTIKYGLFSGTFTPKFEEPSYEIKMTCLISNNTCAYLCGRNVEVRKIQLERLLKGENFTANEICPHLLILRLGTEDSELNNSVNQKILAKGREFLNAGLYISTNIFLVISLLFGLMSAVFSIWIIATNPIDISLSICAVYTYNIVACVSSLLTLILWGIFFRTDIVNNIGILYTIQGQMDTSGMVHLGFCYWLILASCLFYLMNAVFVHTKQHPINPEQETQLIWS